MTRLYWLTLWHALRGKHYVPPGLVLIPRDAWDICVARVAKAERRAAGQRNRRRTVVKDNGASITFIGPQELSQ